MNKDLIVHYKHLTGYTSDLEKCVEQNPNRKWDWKFLSCNPQISLEFILSHPEMKWQYDWVVINPNVTYNDVMTYNMLYANIELFYEYNPNVNVKMLTYRVGYYVNPMFTYDDFVLHTRTLDSMYALYNPLITRAQYDKLSPAYSLLTTAIGNKFSSSVMYSYVVGLWYAMMPTYDSYPIINYPHKSSIVDTTLPEHRIRHMLNAGRTVHEYPQLNIWELFNDAIKVSYLEAMKLALLSKNHGVLTVKGMAESLNKIAIAKIAPGLYGCKSYVDIRIVFKN